MTTSDVRTVIEDGHTYRVLTITDDQRSMIASAVASACDTGSDPPRLLGTRESRLLHEAWHAVRVRRSLCCAKDRGAACAAIVGEEFSDALHDYVYGELGCSHTWEQRYLDKISALRELRYEVVN